MKVNREHLKSIIREVLVELLQEGLGSSLVAETTRHVAQPSRQPAPRHLGPTRVHQPPRKQIPQRVVPQTPQAVMVNEVANVNPVLASIMADTLATTFETQTAADGARESIARQMSGEVQWSNEANTDPDPETLTGDAARWAAALGHV